MELKGLPFSLDRIKFDQLYATYLGMSPKQQTVALVATVSSLLLVILLPFMVATRSIHSLERNIDEGTKGLRKVVREIESYNATKTRVESLEQAMSKGFDQSIASTMEALADKAGIKDHIDSLKAKPIVPSELIDESSVDVRLKQVQLPQLVQFLASIENHPDKILRLENLDISPRYDNKEELDASFTVSTFRLRSASAAEGE